MNIAFPKGEDAIEYLASFAEAFESNDLLKGSLLSTQDNLRQAALIQSEPLGYFACLTAEEEAASFLYYALRDKGYPVPDHGKIQQHPAKSKVLVVAVAMANYFFGSVPSELSPVLRVEDKDGKPSVSLWLQFSEQTIVQDDPLSAIIVQRLTHGGTASHDAEVNRSINEVIDSFVPRGTSAGSAIKALANQRNLCLYGIPSQKPRMVDGEGLAYYREKCVCILTLAFAVLNSPSATLSMQKLVSQMYKQLQAT